MAGRAVKSCYAKDIHPDRYIGNLWYEGAHIWLSKALVANTLKTERWSVADKDKAQLTKKALD